MKTDRNSISYFSKILFLLTLFAPTLLTACSNKKEMHANTANQGTQGPVIYQIPQVPQSITDPQEKTNYITANYWNNFNFNDTLSLHNNTMFVKQTFLDFASILPHADIKNAVAAIKNSLYSASKEKSGKEYAYFIEMYKETLYDPNSKLRNDQLYQPVLETIVNDSVSSEGNKARAQFDLEMLKKNQVGTKAQNFTYTLASGKTGTLYNFKSEYTLLMFYNPDCHSCKETMTKMIASETLKKAEQSNVIKVLAVFPDETVDIWRKHLNQIPADWTNSYDKGLTVTKKRLYDLKAIPTLYLLDENKNVILKDADITVVEAWLQQNLPMIYQSY